MRRQLLAVALHELQPLRVESPAGTFPLHFDIKRELHGDAGVEARVKRAATIAQASPNAAIWQRLERNLAALYEAAPLERRRCRELEPVYGSIDEAAGRPPLERCFAEQRP